MFLWLFILWPSALRILTAESFRRSQPRVCGCASVNALISGIGNATIVRPHRLTRIL
jgi:hypothetical protein